MLSFSKQFFLLFLTVFAAASSLAQQYDVPLGSWLEYEVEKAYSTLESTGHSAVRPYRMDELPSGVDSALLLRPQALANPVNQPHPGRFKLVSGLLQNSLITVRDSGFLLHIDPLFEFGGVYEDQTSELYTVNGRGLRLRGSIGEKMSFQTSFLETQGFFPGYQETFIQQNRVVPGVGRVKRFNQTGWDYQNATGKISWSPSDYFNLQFGSDKNMLGDGYRSLLLSDNAVNYPFLKLTTKVWKLKYTNLYAQFRETTVPKDPELGFPRKWTALHHLSYNVTKRLNIGLFEALIWENSDSAGYRGIELEYMNPIMLLRPSEFNTGSVDNALLGMNASYKLADGHLLYGQVVIDEFKLERVRAGNGWWGNKQGFQLGYKAFDLLGIPNLGLRTEVNYVRPFTYSHWKAEQSYGHMGQSLAHPLGANFVETVTQVRYRKHRFFGRAQFNYSIYGAEETNNYVGHSIFTSYDQRAGTNGYFVGSGNRSELYYMSGHVGYLLNPVYDMTVELGATARSLSDESAATDRVLLVQLTFKAGLGNRYFDF